MGKLSCLALFALTTLSADQVHGQAKVAALPLKATGVQPALVGTTVPNIELVSRSGEELNLSAARGGKPSVIVIYRGGW